MNKKLSQSLLALTIGASMSLPIQAAAQEDGFRVGDTTISMYGYIKLDAIAVRTSDGDLVSDTLRDLYVPATTPVEGLGLDSSESLTLQARESRFGFRTVTDVGTGTPLKGLLEMDFGPGRDLLNGTSTTNRASVNLRHAFFEYGNWGFGQTWSTALFGPAMTETLNFFSLSEGIPSQRTPLLRYKSGPWAVALENATTTAQLTGADTTRASGKSDASDGVIPDLVVRYAMMGKRSQLALVGIVRELRVDGAVAGVTVDESEVGYGLGVAGNVKVTNSTDLKFMLFGGSGIGRYTGLGLNPDVEVANDGSSMDAVDHVAFNVGAAHRINNNWRTNVGFGMENADVDGQKLTEKSWSGTANLLYSPAPALTFGAEVKYGERTLVDGSDGNQTRLQFSAKYSFGS